jgi:outer membrane protein assembly factor BamB
MKISILIALVFFGTVFVAGPVAAQSPFPVTTYHYDTLRTGWNNHETILTATSFPSNFTMLANVGLDDQVDAQPLFVPGLTIAGGTHDVVYVATEHNTIYAIDASSGTILKSTNLGSDVPHSLGCRNNGPSVGITATPVIDVAAKALYVIACVKGPPESMNSTPSI